MIRFERMTIEHARAIRPQPSQNDLTEDERVTELVSASTKGDAWTFFAGDKLLGIAGITALWSGRAMVWMLMDEGAGRHLLPLTRFLSAMIDEYGYPRVEMFVDATFAAGCRWAKMLGFTLETPVPARRYMPNGNDAYLYARVI